MEYETLKIKTMYDAVIEKDHNDYRRENHYYQLGRELLEKLHGVDHPVVVEFHEYDVEHGWSKPGCVRVLVNQVHLSIDGLTELQAENERLREAIKDALDYIGPKPKQEDVVRPFFSTKLHLINKLEQALKGGE